MNTDTLKSANDVVRHARGDRDAQLLYLIEDMIERIRTLEVRLDRLSDLTVGDDDQPFDERVLEVLRVRSGSSREALEIDDRILSVIEENSYTVYTHIEAEIENKLEDLTESHAFAAAVEDAVKGSLVGTIEQVLEDTLHDAIIDAMGDAEDIVRKGLRALI